MYSEKNTQTNKNKLEETKKPSDEGLKALPYAKCCHPH